MSVGVIGKMSQACNLITQINRVCREIRDMKFIATKIHDPLSSYRRSNGHLRDIDERDGRGCTHLVDNKKHVHYKDLCNNPHSPAHRETPSPPLILPPSSPSPTSSHASSGVSSSESSTSFDEPPSCWMDDTVGEMMVLSSSQKETKESLEEQDSRGGGLTCPDRKSVV